MQKNSRLSSARTFLKKDIVLTERNADLLMGIDSLWKSLLQNVSEQRDAMVFGSMDSVSMECDASSHTRKLNGK